MFVLNPFVSRPSSLWLRWAGWAGSNHSINQLIPVLHTMEEASPLDFSQKSHLKKTGSCCKKKLEAK